MTPKIVAERLAARVVCEGDREEGPWLLFRPDGSLTAHGVFVAGERDGVWIELPVGAAAVRKTFNKGTEVQTDPGD